MTLSRGRQAAAAHAGAARVPLCLTFDNMGSAASVRRGVRTGQDPADPSLLIGYPRILALLGRLGLRATFFIEGWNALHNPDLCRAVADAGHEIGLHGWIHEDFASLDEHDSERLLVDARAAFRAIGIDPRGFRASGGARGTGLVPVLRRLGIAYDASSNGDDAPMRVTRLEGDLPNVPWRWTMIDYYQYHMHPEGTRTAAQLEDAFQAELDRARGTDDLVTFIFHAHTSGVDDDRFAAMERLLTRAAADPGIEIVAAARLARRVDRTTEEARA